MNIRSINFKINSRILAVITIVFMILAVITIRVTQKSIQLLVRELLENKVTERMNIITARYTSLDNMLLANDEKAVKDYQKQLLDSIKEFKYKKTGVMYVLDDTGKVLINSGGDGTSDYSNQKFFSDMKSKSSGMVTYTLDGRAMTAVYGLFDKWRWFVVVEMEDVEIYAELHSFVWTFAAICVIALVMIAAIFWLAISFGVIRPITTVTNAILDIAEREADLTHKIDYKSKDELGMLVVAFNKIIDSIYNVIKQVKNTSNTVVASSQNMSATTQEMNASTQEVSSAILQVSKGASSQADHLTRTFEIIEKLAVSLRQVVANAQLANQTADKTSHGAEEAYGFAQEAVEKIEVLNSSVKIAADVIQELGETSKQIGVITDTITSIADQINLLALNAAIEAARAGEAGRGFAVVAEEVRKLAEGSADAVRKISGYIRSIQGGTAKAVSAILSSSTAVQEGKTKVIKIAGTLRDINTSIKEAAGLISQIAAAGTERVEETENIVKSINEVAAIAKQSAATAQQVSSTSQEQTASMEEVSASSQELARLAMDLRDVVNRFKI